MNKAILSALALALALPFAASAASISNPLFSNGQTSIDATGGSTVSGTFTLTVGAGEVIEFLRTQSDFSQPFVDTSVGGQLGYEEQVYTNVPFSVKVPPNTGTYSPTVQGAGIFGGGRAINGGDNVVLGTVGLGTVRVVTGNAGSSSGSNYGGTTDALMEMIYALRGEICRLSGGEWAPATKTCGTKPAPAKPAACANIIAYNGTNAWVAQASLLASPWASPFHAVGVYAPTGNWKSASMASAALAADACK